MRILWLQNLATQSRLASGDWGQEHREHTSPDKGLVHPLRVDSLVVITAAALCDDIMLRGDYFEIRLNFHAWILALSRRRKMAHSLSLKLGIRYHNRRHA